jgi:outer membrane immunogenic protein
MRRLSAAFISSLTIVAFTQMASAAAPKAIYDPRSGFYVGFNFGYSWGRTSTDYTTFDPALVVTETNSDSVQANGVIGGGQIGFNYRFNQRFLAGIEADFQGSGEKGSNTAQICHDNSIVVGAVCDFGNIYDSYTEKLEWFGTVRGRLGSFVDPNWLVYATGGLAYGKLSRSDTYTYNDTFFCNSGAPPACTPQSNSISAVKVGWAIGGGIATALSGTL